MYLPFTVFNGEVLVWVVFVMIEFQLRLSIVHLRISLCKRESMGTGRSDFYFAFVFKIFDFSFDKR